MNGLAQEILAKLLKAGNKTEAGLRTRSPAIGGKQLTKYHGLRNWHQKQECEEVFIAAREKGLISFTRDPINPHDGLIERIELIDLSGLAAFMGVDTHASILEEARTILAPLRERHPVIEAVLQRWASMEKVRGLGPDDVSGWLVAARAISLCKITHRPAAYLPLKEFSAKHFKDSKRLTKCKLQIDILLCDAIDSDPRPASQIWQELGLAPQEHPVLLAGNVQVDRGRVSGYLDAPYSGLSAATIRSIQGPVTEVLSIENLTTFHTEARKRCDEPVLLIYSAGMPSPAWREMYLRLLQSVPLTTRVGHWGDVDEGGFRIASAIAQVAMEANHRLQPHLMAPENVPQEMRVPATSAKLQRMERYAIAAGWPEIGKELVEAKFTSEQEALAADEED